ncbi:restriction endonuclease subunit S [Anaerotruncus colihominis]|uniref:Restriction endonuclease subunit S n=1 Tax=Anaerotruncus colihominis TaxID=169435 RepID=A0A3E3IE53_9FIRM|nr:restriction endonuclease subunit S [Anaerotruncus colihominis]RGE65337.1 restriction endonuclease subunit S [Anaerotruncus colihominis]
MSKYESYKPIEELWLTQIPDSWEDIKIKFLFSERSEKGYPDEPLLVASQNMGVVPKGVYGNRTVQATKDLHLLKLVRVGDFVISLRSFQGGIEYAYYQGIISPAYTIMVPKQKIVPGYFRYLAKSRLFIELLQLCVTGIREGQNIDYGKLKNHLIPVPPSEEQDQIVRYLDWQTSKVNRLINAKKRIISLLEEQQQATIAYVVTRGLDQNAELMDSRIDYIGKVPAHWKVLLNHRIYKEKSRKFGEEETVLSLSQKDGLLPYENMKERSLHTASYENWKLVFPNDLVLNRFKAHLGVFFSSNYRGIVTFHYGVYEPVMKISSKYYEALYHTPEFRRVFASKSNGMTVGLQNLSNTNFYSVYTVYPPHEEQCQIVCKIKEIEEKYRDLIAKINQEIDCLHEYRTRLISDVVTGQIDVRNIEVPDFEMVEEAADEAEEPEDEMEVE